MPDNYGRRKGDVISTIPPIILANMTDTQKVINMLRDGLVSHDTRLQNMRDELNEHDGDIQVLRRTVITGDDNTLSHAERLRKVEGFVEKLEESLRYWGRLIGGALLLNFIGFMIGIVVAIVRFLPLLEKLANQP